MAQPGYTMTMRDLRSAAPGIRSTGYVRIAGACTAWLGVLNLLQIVDREAHTRCSAARRAKSCGGAVHCHANGRARQHILRRHPAARTFTAAWQPGLHAG